MAVAPRHPLPRPEGLDRVRRVEEHRRRHVPGGRHEHGALAVREHQRALRRELVRAADRVVLDVAAGRLRVQPLLHVALGAAGAVGELGRRERARARHRRVQPELVADPHHHAAVARRQVPDHPVEQCREPLLIHLHHVLLGACHRRGPAWRRGAGRDEGRARHGRSVRATLRPVSTRPPTRVSLVAIPEAMPSTLMGLHDVLSSVGLAPDAADAHHARRRSRSRSSRSGPGRCRSSTGVPVTAARGVARGGVHRHRPGALDPRRGRALGAPAATRTSWTGSPACTPAGRCSARRAPGCSRSPRRASSTAGTRPSTGTTPPGSARSSRRSSSTPRRCWW